MFTKDPNPKQKSLDSLLAIWGSPGRAGTQLWEEGKRSWLIGAGDVWLSGPLMGPQKAKSQAMGVFNTIKHKEEGI